jgi:hypothetical protein
MKKYEKKLYQPGYIVDVYSATTFPLEGEATTVPVLSGIPLQGMWVRVPDYMEQVTAGHAINDVIHAQIVDPYTNMSVRITDGEFPIGGRTYVFHECLTSQNPSGFVGMLSIRAQRKMTDKDDEVTDFARIATESVFVDVSLRHGYTGSGTYGTFRCRPTLNITVYALPEDFSFDVSQRDPRTKTYRWFSQVIADARPDSKGHWTPYWYREMGNMWMIPGIGRLLGKLLSATLPSTNEDRSQHERWYAELVETLRSVDVPILVSLCRGYGTLPNTLHNIRPFDPTIYDVSLKRSFLLGETDYVKSRDRKISYINPSSKLFSRGKLMQDAFMDAINNIPRLSDNEFQNILELASLLRGLAVDRTLSLPKTLSDVWLQYRYRYNTSIADYQEFLAFCQNMATWGRRQGKLEVRGKAHRTIMTDDGQEVPVTCVTTVRLRAKELDQFGQIARALYHLGLGQSSYAIWDSIPYSFMVDWVFPIGNILNGYDLYKNFRFSYEIKEGSFSFSYTHRVARIGVKNYTRWRFHTPPRLNASYWFEDVAGVSTATSIKRGIDAATIFLGR